MGKKQNAKVISIVPPAMSPEAYWFLATLADLCLCRNNTDYLLQSLSSFVRSLTPEIFSEVFGEQAEAAKERNIELYQKAKNLNQYP